MEATEFVLFRYRAEMAKLLRAVDALQVNGKREVSNVCEAWIVANVDMETLLKAATDAGILMHEEDPRWILGEEWVRATR